MAGNTPKRRSLDKRVIEEQESATRAGNRVSFFCYRCGKAYGRLKGNFPVSHSPLYRGVGYLPICSDCIESMFDKYAEKWGKKEALHRMCARMDLYWSEDIYTVVERTAGMNSWVRSYISKCNMTKWIDKSYDDTMDEEISEGYRAIFERNFEAAANPTAFQKNDEDPESDTEPEFEIEISQEDLAFWGAGYAPEAYADLNQRYSGWVGDRKDISVAERAIYKQICVLEWTIARDSALGKPIDKHVNALNNLLGSANMKPAQQKNDVADELEDLPLGVGIGRLETIRPVPKPDPQFQDVDGIVRYITVWFLGHLCHMLGIRNTYCRLYEEEMARMRVTAPEFQDDSDDETLFDNIFGNSGGDDE